MQFRLGAQVDLDAQGFLDLHLQPHQVQHRGAGRHIDQQVDVAAFVVGIACHRPEDPYPAGAPRRGQRKNAFTL